VEILVVVLVVAVLAVIAGVGVVAVRRGRAGIALEPPPTPSEPEARRRPGEPPPVLVDEPAPGTVVPPPVTEPAVVEGAAPVVDEGALVKDAAPAPTVTERPSLRDRLGKARSRLTSALGGLRGSRIDDEAWEELEFALLGADVGVQATGELLGAVRARVATEGLGEGDELLAALKAEMLARLDGADTSLAMAAESPTVWLLVGVNGVGKTTTAGKLAHREVTGGRSVMLAAGDTFRAAAAEQLTMWADRTGASIVRGADGSDPSAVVFDAIESAAAKGCDLVVADTAGRLHTKTNLMEELGKVRRVADKGRGTVTEALLVLDATTGQNGLVQARQFADAVQLTGVVLTKLDGSAKGGIVLAIQQELGVPVKLVGLGETANDLVGFDAAEFVDALFD
jgi:fused signal recognition particle receptor